MDFADCRARQIRRNASDVPASAPSQFILPPLAAGWLFIFRCACRRAPPAAHLRDIRHLESLHIETQTPAPQRCPDAHCCAVEQVQIPFLHCPSGPHWTFVTQVPHVPWAQACPPAHWLFDEHALQAPAMQASPGRPTDPKSTAKGAWLQS
jgi:hypothetical protein